ncbi:MAG TPA: BspA family leucine-rich repeat surface protein, partial [Flavobacteriaceae bacterium]|nr:BspA family leucine-rich repeat surface protein [Flavobacteriaceae bacterium]
TYTVTQDDVDNGSVENLAVVNANDENDDPLEETESTNDIDNPGKPGIPGEATVTIITSPPISGAPFVTIWNTGNSGASGNGQIIIPAHGQYNYTWENLGDPTQQGGGSATGTIVLSLPAVGEFKLSMTPTGSNPFHQIKFNDGGDKLKIISVENWGTIEWSSMEKAFYGAENLIINAVGIPNLDNVSDMSYAFAGTNIENVVNMHNWNTSEVTDLSSIFENASSFNESIETWDVSNVTDMTKAFKGATAFNQSLNNWEVTNVISMQSMFEGAASFNQPLSSWDVQQVSTIISMFKNASNFNQNLNTWEISQITDMTDLFNGASSFNQSLSLWDVSNVVKMYGMFANTSAFNQNLSSWNVSNVNNMNYMFMNALAYNQDLSSWDVSNVTLTKGMFAGTQSFNQPLHSWDVSQVKDMEAMFENASGFDQSLEDWDLNSLETAKNMLNHSGINCLKYSQTLKAWSGNPNTPTHITLGAENMSYSTQVEEHRNYLITSLGWNILEDILGSCLLSVDSEAEITFEIYPNPTKDILYINGLAGSESIKLFDLHGRLIKSLIANKQEEIIDMTEFASGVYFLNIEIGNTIQNTKKIIKQQ